MGERRWVQQTNKQVALPSRIGAALYHQRCAFIWSRGAALRAKHVLVGEVTETDEKEDTEASCLPPSCSTIAPCPPPASTQTHSHSGQSKEATIARGCSDLGLNALKEKAGAGRESNNGLRLRREWWAQLESVGTTGQLPTPPSVLCLLLLRTGPAQYPSIGGIKTAFDNWECNEENKILI